MLWADRAFPLAIFESEQWWAQQEGGGKLSGSPVELAVRLMLRAS